MKRAAAAAARALRRSEWDARPHPAPHQLHLEAGAAPRLVAGLRPRLHDLYRYYKAVGGVWVELGAFHLQLRNVGRNALTSLIITEFLP